MPKNHIKGVGFQIFTPNIKLREEDQALIVLCSLPMSSNNFVNSMLYDGNTISLLVLKSALNSVELKTKLNLKGMDNKASSLCVKGSSSWGRYQRRVGVNLEVIHSQSLLRKMLSVITVIYSVITKMSVLD